MNRKLIRPDLRDPRERRPSELPQAAARRRSLPPDETHAESNYYLKQMAARTRMVIVLTDGEELRGTIEWYDKDALKVHRADAPNLLLMKTASSTCTRKRRARPRGRPGGRVSRRPRLALTVGDPPDRAGDRAQGARVPSCPPAEWVVYGPLALLEEARAVQPARCRDGAQPRLWTSRRLPWRSGRSRPREGERPPRPSRRRLRRARGRVAGSSRRRFTRRSLRAAGLPGRAHRALAEAAGVSDVAMLFVGGGLRWRS
jgi:sRNA-binding regulator protein Hfq